MRRERKTGITVITVPTVAVGNVSGAGSGGSFRKDGLKSVSRRVNGVDTCGGSLFLFLDILSLLAIIQAVHQLTTHCSFS